MFCEAPFCDLPFASIFEIFVNGEIFYFDADIQQLVSFVFDIQQSGDFILDIQQEKLFPSTIIR
jgi:hypothetical protein